MTLLVMDQYRTNFMEIATDNTSIQNTNEEVVIDVTPKLHVESNAVVS